MSAEQKYRAIKGVQFKKRDGADFSPEKWTALLKFAQFFISEKDKYDFSIEKRKQFELRAMEEPFWLEFSVRIDQPLFKDNATPRGFSMRAMSLIREPLNWLKSNPFAITEEMRKIMEKSDRMNWALEPFKSVKTKIGAEIVKVNNKETTDPNMANVQPASSNLTLPEVQLNHALLAMTSILKNLTKGISSEAIKKMSAETRIKLATGMVQSLGKTFATYKPNKQVFKQLVVNNASKDDLERAILDFNQD